MRVLFVNPYIYDFTAYDLWVRPLGMLYLASVVQKYTDCEIHWLDALDRFQNLNHPGPMPDDEAAGKSPVAKQDGRGKFHREIVDKPEFYKNVPRHYSRYGIPFSAFQNKLNSMPDIDLVFITSLMTYWIDGICFTVDSIKKRFPRAPVILGGVLPTLLSEKVRRLISVDGIISGPGEKKILDLLAAKGVKIRQSPDFSDVNAIPLPAFEYLSNRRILPLLTSRGCPYHCSYCATHQLNPIFMERTPENIIHEISEFTGLYQPEHFIIFDDALLINQNHRFKRIFPQIRAITNARFHTPNGLHAREIREDTAHILYESGFRTLRLSFESIAPELLAKSSHKVTVGEMVQAVHHLEKAGYRRDEIEVYLLFGIQSQTRKMMEDTLFFIRDLGVIPRLSYYSPVPGTRDFSELQNAGILSKNLNIYETNKTFFVYQKSQFSHQDIQELKELTNLVVRHNRRVNP